LQTILVKSDIFAALIEGRCYKSASSCDAAYQVLLDMGARLDSRLVGEFRAVLPLLAGLR
jgi:HD-GYP domain-containing protein (c-di-GMP phosphodiesterase class II)